MELFSPFSSFVPDGIPTRTTIIHFSPWLFSNQENLTTAFFHELEKQLDNTWGNIKCFLKVIAALTLPSLEALSYLNPTTSKLVGNTTQHLIKNLQKRPSLEQAKQALNKALKAQKRPILIIIDDIDRLPADEMRQIFRMVKAVADLPYVTYLLGFDRKIVKRALEKDTDLEGPQWIEKIVQGSFDLPIVLPHKLKQFFWDKLSKELPDLHKQLKLHEGSSYFLAPFFEEFIFKPIQTPRQINRLINALIVQWMAVNNSVNPFDLIFIETCRLFNQNLYQEIKNNKELFVNPNPQYVNNLKEKCSNFDLFEKLFFRNHTFELYFQPINRINLDNFFYNYFLYDVYDHNSDEHLVPEYDIIDTYLNNNEPLKIIEIIKTLLKKDTEESIRIRQNNKSKLSNIIDRWSNNIDTYSRNSLNSIIEILVNLYLKIDLRLMHNIQNIFDDILKKNMSRISSDGFLFQLYEKYPFSDLLIYYALQREKKRLAKDKIFQMAYRYSYENTEFFTNLKKFYIPKMLELDKNKELQKSSSDLILLFIIYTEERLSADSKYESQWIQNKIFNHQEDDLLLIIEKLVSQEQNTGINYINNDFQHYVDLNPIIYFAKKIVKDSDNEDSRKTAQNFLDAYNNQD